MSSSQKKIIDLFPKNQTLDSEPRTCTDCGVRKTVSDFHKDKKGTQGRVSTCKKCTSAYQARWHANQPLEKRQQRNRRNKYGISPERFDELFIHQGGSCAICREILEKSCSKTVVDHDHKTGMVRGILCKKCNTTLGWARDDLKWLESAIQYLLLNRVM